MAPTLRSMRISGFQNQQTLSVIDEAMKSKSSEFENTEDRQNAPESSHMERALFDHLAAKGKYLQDYMDLRHSDKNAKDKDLLSDEQMENVAVWIQETDSGPADEPEDQNKKRMDEYFRQYTHHHFVGQWGILGPDTGKSEEWWVPDPEILPKDHPDYLCEMCRHINFRALFTQRGLPGNETPGPTSIRLHAVDEIVHRQNCTFCRLITAKIVADGVIDLGNTEALGLISIRLNVVDEGQEYALRLEIELEEARKAWPTQRYIIQQCGAESALPYTASFVEREAADLGILLRWLKTCDASHTSASLAKEQLKRLKFIDVEDNRVRTVDLPCQYTCLSYVWGGVQQITNIAVWRKTLEQCNGLSSSSLQLPKTITDAIEVTRRLGIRYLWVDALCIEQDKEADVRENVSNMASIYSEASLTIVASTNLDPTQGLPGVTTVPRSREQILGTVQGVEMAVAFHDARMPLNAIESSKWNSRGWTYQERQLSNRLIFFTESQMVFLCSNAALFEDTVSANKHDHRFVPVDDYDGAFANPHDLWYKIWSDPSQFHYVNKTFKTKDGTVTMIGEELDEELSGSDKFNSIAAPVYEHKIVPKTDVNGTLKIQGQSFWDIYRQAVASYTRRQLSNAQDIMPAFEGLSDMIRQGANIRFWYNLPSCAFDRALLWYPVELCVRRQHEGMDLHPSWSWAGWDGAIRYRGRGWYNGLNRGPVSVVKWLRRPPPQAWLENNWKHLSQRPDAEEIRSKVVNGVLTTLELVNPHTVHCFDDYNDATSGWTSIFNSDRNQHSYINSSYPNLILDYPAPSKDQDLVVLPSATGALHFQAYATPIYLTDMTSQVYIRPAQEHAYLQIGMNDEHKSANGRPETHKILYHQGYRAGYVVFNISFSSQSSQPPEFTLVAMSRDDIPRTYPPNEPLDIYRALGPVELQWNLGFLQYYQMETAEFVKTNVMPPNEDVEAETGPWNDNGDPLWDQGRFGNPGIYPVYNVLILEKLDDSEGGYRRVGVGKIYYGALHHANAEWKTINLR